ncbi:ANTAR domain-containing protein [Streptomyces sp. TRM43335]|uniref:ANTAR domain-containing protein n=1 Tax=Streptomyces taklimakanensis TaxID=2569853 RepID=A0A6G2BCG7_9ACTN|nr:ANTAR domain-containing protein [Streptomyces taklimakanensis]MTE19914.1 ANTAR domain-containing protein [Streptomyces taklimakanensis]
MAPSFSTPADFEAIFHTTVSPLLVLDTALVIRDVNRSYAAVTFREREELVGRHMFDAFPANPHDPDADGVRNLDASFRRVLARRTEDAMGVQKYDIPFPDSPTGFREKYWLPLNSPVLAPDGEVTALLHHVEDVTGFHEELARIEHAYRRTDTPTPRTHTAVAQRGYARHLAQAADEVRRLEELREEVEQLRQALHSRAVIDQAIGIVQAERRCNPEDAFQILVTVSQRTNVKLRDIATALVRRAEDTPPGLLLPEFPSGTAPSGRRSVARRERRSGAGGRPEAGADGGTRPRAPLAPPGPAGPAS